MATNLFARAKAYRRKHPKTEWKDCVKKAAKMGATKKKKKSSSKKKAVRKKPKKVGAITRNTDRVDKKNVSVNIGSVASTQAHLRKLIAKRVGELEQKKMAAKTVKQKKHYIRMINKLKQDYRKVSV